MRSVFLPGFQQLDDGFLHLQGCVRLRKILPQHIAADGYAVELAFLFLIHDVVHGFQCALSVLAQALEALRTVYTRLQALAAREPEKFLFFNKMHAPIKRIQNKFRYQVLMRLTDGGPLPEIYAACDGAGDKTTLVYVEENPSNLS